MGRPGDCHSAGVRVEPGSPVLGLLGGRLQRRGWGGEAEVNSSPPGSVQGKGSGAQRLLQRSKAHLWGHLAGLALRRGPPWGASARESCSQVTKEKNSPPRHSLRFTWPRVLLPHFN